MPLATVPELLEELRQGRCIVLVDDEDRENEGDLVCAAEFATPEAINFMAKHGRGLICLTLTPEQSDKLGLRQMVPENTALHGTAFTVSIDAIEGCTTGISAADRSRTILTAIKPDVRPAELARPGHIFPLVAREGGVLVRAGQTEGSVDLCRLAGLKPFGVICEIMDDSGEMSRMPALEAFCQSHTLKLGSIASLVEYRLARERLVTRRASVALPTEFGHFNLHMYSSILDDRQHLLIVKGDRLKPRDLGGEEVNDPVLLRVHSECCTGDIFGSLRCDCRAQLHAALRMIERQGEGVVLYLRQEGRGIGLEAKLKAYSLQDQGLDTVEANRRLGFKDDERHYGIGSQILRDIGVNKMRLMSNNPRKIHGVSGYGLELVERVPLEIEPHELTQKYLSTKKSKMGHFLDGV
ncbi:MAG: GTP cyclohydrolase II [Planctomycetota bacterium]